MYDLLAFRERVRELARRGNSYEGRRPTQGDLAEAIGLSHAELSKRLNGTQGKSLAESDIRAIVRQLAEWGAIGTRGEAIELLDLLDCPHFSAAEWQSPPLDMLTAPDRSDAASAAHGGNPGLAPSNLPVSLTSFIGRGRQVVRITELLERTRLLTLTGAGGCGKTRLALEVAARLMNRFPAGVWLVELAGLSEEHLLAQTIAVTLGIREQRGVDIAETLIRYLGQRQILLVIDNCEHLTGAVATLIHRLLMNCSRLQVLATSREVLRTEGEVSYRVPSLSLPDQAASHLPQTLLGYEAIRLFVERARAVLPDFSLTPANALLVSEICAELDGIPLALELAAARLGTMDINELRCRLGDRFRLLTGGSRTTLPRHQTLRALVDWSYALLPADEQRLFRRLSVFARGFQLDAAEWVCADERIADYRIAELLGELVDKSLVVVEEQSNSGYLAVRYHLLETLRQYGARLLGGDEQGQVRARHRDWFIGFARSQAAELKGIKQSEALNQLEREHDNLRAALGWSLTARMGADEHHEAALRLGAALWWFWRVRGYISEGRRWLQSILDLPGGAAEAVAEALTGAGTLAYVQGDHQVARAQLAESLALGREIGDKLLIAGALRGLGSEFTSSGDYQQAQTLFGESLMLWRELGDKDGIASALNNSAIVACELGEMATAERLFEESLQLRRDMGDQFGMSTVLGNLGKLALIRGDYQAARQLSEEGLAIDRALNNQQGMGTSLASLGEIAWKQGDYPGAEEFYQECLRLCQHLGNKHGITFDLDGLADVAEARTDGERAAILRGAAEALREAIGITVQPSDRAQYERRIARTRAQLDEAAFTRAWAKGRELDLEQAILYALKLDTAS